MARRKSNHILYFYFDEHEITCFIQGQVIWWNFNDVRNALKIKRIPNLIHKLNLNESEWQYTYYFQGAGDNGKVIAISETGLPKLIREKAAPEIGERFKKWLKTEVLPEINKKI